jgi:signal transduction histidine kinase
MAVPPEAVQIIMVVMAMIMVALQYHISKRSGTWFFIFGLLCSSAIAISLMASMPWIAGPSTQALADIGILLAGCAAFASSAWLLIAFKMAGEPDDR